MNDVTRILSSIDQGDPKAADQLLPLVYDELRRLAASKLAHERPGLTLQPTALVHEAYLRLVGRESGPSWNSRLHFIAAAAEAMRRILIDDARRRLSLKRGGGNCRIALDEFEAEMAGAGGKDIDLLALDEALSDLERIDPTKAKLVQLRYFAGLTIEEAAQVLDVSPATANRAWVFARAWLYGRLHE